MYAIASTGDAWWHTLPEGAGVFALTALLVAIFSFAEDWRDGFGLGAFEYIVLPSVAAFSAWGVWEEAIVKGLPTLPAFYYAYAMALFWVAAFAGVWFERNLEAAP